jgi:diguanylate cyclase (GGDEF)-like protein
MDGRDRMAEDKDSGYPELSALRSWSDRQVAVRTNPRQARFAFIALGVGLVLVLAFAVWMDRPAGSILYLVAGAYGTLMSCVGASRMPPARRRIWWAIAAGQGLFLLGDLLWTLFEDVLHIAPYPSVADVAYLLSYPAIALGVMWLIRGRRRGRDRAAFLDAAILSTGFTVVGTVFFIAPAAASGGTSTLSQVVAAAYPAGDLIVLAVVIRMLTTGTVRNLSLWALVTGIAAILVVDLYYVMSVVNGAAYPAWIDHGYLLSYLLLGFAALHPSAHVLSEPAPDRPDRITVARLAFLGAALMLAPVTGQLADILDPDRRGGSLVVLIGGVLSACLVVLRMWDLIQSLQRKAVQLAALARRDGLTGIANRRTWDHELSRACAFAREQGTPLSVAVLDMDHFKLFNDTNGHVLGDLVLKETAAAWVSILHGRGFLARYGGEEFAVLLPKTTSPDAEQVLDRLRRTVTHAQTCSIGLAEWDGVETPAHVFARADQALYHAKHGGRDRVAVHDGRTISVSAVGAGRDHRPETSMRSVFQPIVDLRTGETVAYEALSRFEGRDPAEVFATAARLGTGPGLEAAAIRQALASWERPETLSVNVSLTALLAPEVQDALPGDLSRIILEITEGDLVDYSAEMMLMLEGLRDRGARIAIDDLGVGFSNVERMVTIEPDIIKLDMSLVRSVDANPMLQAVIVSAVLFAQQTGSQLVAEGVETQQERDFLSKAGVALGQGFLIGRPEPCHPVPADHDGELSVRS